MSTYSITSLEDLKILSKNSEFKRLIIDNNVSIIDVNGIEQDILNNKNDSTKIDSTIDNIKAVFQSRLASIIEKWEEIDTDSLFFKLNIDSDVEHEHEHEHDHDDFLAPEGITSEYNNTLENVEASTATNNDLPGFSTYDTTQAFSLNSNLDSNYTIYLDFDGHTTSGTSWTDNVTPSYDLNGNNSEFNTTERQKIIDIWKIVSEDFIPFDVNVTTETPTIDQLQKSGNGDTEWGVRVIIGGDGAWYKSGIGGVAYLNSFDWSSDTPTYVFSENFGSSAKNIAEAVSHEVGHTMGLSHDGQGSTSYYQGANGWASIMGVGYYQPLTQWSKGEYTDATNTQDDLAIITGGNGFGYRVDDHGGATALTDVNGILSGFGIIEQNTDFDYFSFSTGGGDVNLTIDTATIGANLDIKAQLFDSIGNSIAISDSTTTLNASFSETLIAGEYFLSVTGTGNGSFYSDYGSLGQYSITGDVVVSTNDFLSISPLTSSLEEGDSGNQTFTFE